MQVGWDGMGWDGMGNLVCKTGYRPMNTLCLVGALDCWTKLLIISICAMNKFS